MIALFSFTTATAHIQDRLKFTLSSLDNKRSTSDSALERDNGLLCENEEIIRLFSNLGTICQNFIFNGEATDFDEASPILCKRCGQNLYALLKCFNISHRDFALYDVLCATNSNNDTCYSLLTGDEQDMIAKCKDLNCSDECHDVLSDSFSEHGCCLYSLVAIDTSMSMASDIWSACGLEDPGICDPAFGENVTIPEPTTEEPIEVTVGTTKPPDTTATPSSDITITLSPKTDGAPTGTGTIESKPPSVSESVVTATVEEQRDEATGVMSLTLAYLLVIAFCCFHAIY